MRIIPPPALPPHLPLTPVNRFYWSVNYLHIANWSVVIKSLEGPTLSAACCPAVIQTLQWLPSVAVQQLLGITRAVQWLPGVTQTVLQLPDMIQTVRQLPRVTPAVTQCNSSCLVDIWHYPNCPAVTQCNLSHPAVIQLDPNCPVVTCRNSSCQAVIQYNSSCPMVTRCYS